MMQFTQSHSRTLRKAIRTVLSVIENDGGTPDYADREGFRSQIGQKASGLVDEATRDRMGGYAQDAAAAATILAAIRWDDALFTSTSRGVWASL